MSGAEQMAMRQLGRLTQPQETSNGLSSITMHASDFIVLCSRQGMFIDLTHQQL